MGILNACYKFCKGSSKMHPKDRLFLSPWQKWRKYRKFPWKILLHCCIVLLVSIQSYLITSQFTYYSRASNATWKYFFTPSSYLTQGIYTYDQCVQAINDSINLYYYFPYQSVDRYMHIRDSIGNIIPVEMHVQAFTNEFIPENGWNTFNSSTNTKTYYLTQGELGPLSNSTPEGLRSFFYKLISLNMKYSFQDVDFGVLGPVLFLWNITQVFDFSNGGGRIDFYVETRKSIVKQETHSLLSLLTAIDVFISIPNAFLSILIVSVLIASFSLILSLKALISGAFFYRKKFNAKALSLSEEDESISDWKDIPFEVKLQFFDTWHFIIILGNSCLIISSVLGLGATFGSPTESFYLITFGLGAFLSYLCLMKYLEFAEKFYILILTLRTSFGNVSRFLISIAPIFFGYVVFGVIVFSDYNDFFVDFIDATQTLFSLLNGDNLFYTFTQLSKDYPYPWIARIYLFSFLLLFITAVLNIFIFIIEDAFHIAKKWSRNENQENKKKEFDIKRLFQVLEQSEKKGPASVPLIDDKNKDIALNTIQQKLEDDLIDIASESILSSQSGLSEKVQALFAENSAAFLKDVEEEIKQIKKIQNLHAKHLQTQLKKLLESQNTVQ